MMKALIALDGSTIADHALRFAGDLLAGQEARVILLHVLPRYRLSGHGAPVTVERHAQDIDEESAAAQVLLQRAAQQLQARGAGRVIKEETALGDPASVILAMADRDDVDLIVLGSQGLNAVERFLIGSVSSKVLAHAHCAVMVVHPPPNGTAVRTDVPTSAGLMAGP